MGLTVSSGNSTSHSVADPGLGEYVPGFAGGITKFMAEPLHHVPDQPSFAYPFGAPHPLEQHAVVQHARRVGCQFA